MDMNANLILNIGSILGLYWLAKGGNSLLEVIYQNCQKITNKETEEVIIKKRKALNTLVICLLLLQAISFATNLIRVINPLLTNN